MQLVLLELALISGGTKFPDLLPDRDDGSNPQQVLSADDLYDPIGQGSEGHIGLPSTSLGEFRPFRFFQPDNIQLPSESM